MWVVKDHLFSRGVDCRCKRGVTGRQDDRMHSLESWGSLGGCWPRLRHLGLRGCRRRGDRKRPWRSDNTIGVPGRHELTTLDQGLDATPTGGSVYLSSTVRLNRSRAGVCGHIRNDNSIVWTPHDTAGRTTYTCSPSGMRLNPGNVLRNIAHVRPESCIAILACASCIMTVRAWRVAG